MVFSPRLCYDRLSAFLVLERYSGQHLGPRPHIAILGSSKVGNFVVTIPLIRALSQAYENAVIDFWGSEITKDFEFALPFVDWRISCDRESPDLFLELSRASEMRLQQHGTIDLVINCDGFNPFTQVLASLLRPTYVAGASLTSNLRRNLPWGDHPYQRFLSDSDWDSPQFLSRYDGYFNSNYIGELLCRLSFLPLPAENYCLPCKDPGFDVPDVLIHVTTTRAAKLWFKEYWFQVLQWCEVRSISLGLVGSPPKLQQEAYNSGDIEQYLLSTTSLIDLRGKTSLIELAGACKQAKAVLSVDAGPLHIAAGVGTPTLAIVGNDVNGVGASPIRLWMPRTNNCSRTLSTKTCDECSAARFKNDACLIENHACMAGVPPSQVTSWLDEILHSSN